MLLNTDLSSKGGLIEDQARKAQSVKQTNGYSLELRIVHLSVHDDRFEHRSLAHHKLNHAVDESQQRPGKAKQDASVCT